VVPLSRPPQRAPGVAAPTRQAIAKRRVLVVDDNCDAAASLALALVLDSLGADVRIAGDGQAVLEAFDADGPALVLLDIGMPGMDGYEVARAIRARPSGVATLLVALTGTRQAAADTQPGPRVAQ
jgi:CheY-like chemotaxis protein